MHIYGKIYKSSRFHYFIQIYLGYPTFNITFISPQIHNEQLVKIKFIFLIDGLII